MAHGVAVNQMITSNMTESQERDHIQSATKAITTAIGRRPAGWFGAEYGESENTVAILADEGFQYVCDWPNDDQPYPMHTPTALSSCQAVKTCKKIPQPIPSHWLSPTQMSHLDNIHTNDPEHAILGHAYLNNLLISKRAHWPGHNQAKQN